MIENSKSILDKLSSINEKTQKIINNSNIQKNENEDFYIKNIDLIQTVHNYFKEVMRNIFYLNRQLLQNADNPSQDEQQLKEAIEYDKKKNSILKKTIETAEKVNELFEKISPTGFINSVVKEMVDYLTNIEKTSRSIDEKVKNRILRFQNDNLQPILEAVKSIDPEEVREKGFAALNPKGLTAFNRSEKIKKGIFAALGENVKNLFTQKKYKVLADMFKLTPYGSIINTLVQIEQHKENIIRALSDYVEKTLNILGPAFSPGFYLQQQFAGLEKTQSQEIMNFLSNLSYSLGKDYPNLTPIFETIKQLQQSVHIPDYQETHPSKSDFKNPGI